MDAVAARLAGLRESAKDRENLLSAYGPLAVFLLLGAWVTLLIVGFALLQWANGSALSTTGEKPTFWVDLYRRYLSDHALSPCLLS